MCYSCTVLMTCFCIGFFFFFKQKTAYELRISDWSSDVCSSDLYAQVPLVWSAADAAMAMMATLNLAALLGLSGVVVKLTRDNDRQLDAGRSPVLDRKSVV